MNSKEQKIFVIVAIGIFVAALIYSLNSEATLFSQFAEQYASPNWDEVSPRNIVKNSIPVVILEKEYGNCVVSAQNFGSIIDHNYFVRSNELSEKLQFDREAETLVLPCDDLEGEKSRLNIWYAVEEAKNHPTKYEYFITPWNETESEK